MIVRVIAFIIYCALSALSWLHTAYLVCRPSARQDRIPARKHAALGIAEDDAA